jgi:hypothetical protein
MANTIEEISNDFLSEAHEDYVGLWSLIWRIKNLLGEGDPQRVRAVTMAVLTELFQEALIKAGMPNAEGEFEEWKDGPDEIIKRIEGEWHQLGREPNIGDIVWFTTTEKGDARMEQRKQKNK